jgi:hypothetical protein
VRTTFSTGSSIAAAFAEVGSMHTLIASAPPLPL